ncbi:MAG: cell division ATP-binding protein FtsE [Ferrimicrobium sp.]|uniref:cell division ATP-binding protein FtsE n=1 Tax=Ferrimicrobium sp. TaxID=2926050 RepID=UPI002619E5F8|nr:cell division ATP-binding protein FtsE [Ferrimicrobium sp.]
MIKFENVSKSYSKGSPAVRDISFEIDRGEFVFLIGSSGSGKTTLIRLMIREEKPDDGTIWVAGKNLVTMPNWKVPHFRRNVGVIFQDFRLLPNKTVAQNVAFALQVIGKPNRFIATQVPQILRLVGLEDKMERFPHQLSGGEQQRVAIARAFVNRPLILLADEPTGNLDPDTSWGVMNLLERINRTGTAVVMATHDVGIVDSMRRRVIEIDNGHLSRDQVRGVYGLGV